MERPPGPSSLLWLLQSLGKMSSWVVGILGIGTRGHNLEHVPKDHLAGVG